MSAPRPPRPPAGEGRSPDARLDARVSLADRGLHAELAVHAGTCLGLTGPNGAGKSTLLAVLGGLLVPDAGHVRVGGRTLTDVAADVHLPPHRRGVVLLPQDPGLFPWLDARDNVAFGVRSASPRRGRASRRAEAETWLARLDAAPLARRRAGELSGGERARVAVARALAADPAVVLLDEPFAAVAADARPGLRRALAAALAGRTALLVSHDAGDLRALCTEVAVLESGWVTRRGPAEQVLGGAPEAGG